jgi:magnesium chelatase family protein
LWGLLTSHFRGIFDAFPHSDFLQRSNGDAGKNCSAAVYGVDAYEVEIEVNGAGGDPNIVIVGLPDAAVRESRDRVTTAIANSGYYWPRGRTTINLAPADIKKEGPSFDLPIALGMIAVTEGLDSSPFENFSFVGELALDGTVRAVKGVLPVALEARRRGKRALFVPEANALEAAMVDKIDIYGVQNLRQTFAFLRGETPLLPTRADLTGFFAATKAMTSISEMLRARDTSNARLKSRWLAVTTS